MQAPTPNTVITFKAALGDDLRRLTFPRDALSFDSLLSRIAQSFGALSAPTAPADFRLTWRDADGDIITLSSPADLAELVAASRDVAVVRVFVSIVVANSVARGGAAPVHTHVTCDGCQRALVGTRFKCLQCPDFDLCGACEVAGRHDRDHVMLRINAPTPASTALVQSFCPKIYWWTQRIQQQQQQQQQHPRQQHPQFGGRGACHPRWGARVFGPGGSCGGGPFSGGFRNGRHCFEPEAAHGADCDIDDDAATLREVMAFVTAEEAAKLAGRAQPAAPAQTPAPPQTTADQTPATSQPAAPVTPSTPVPAPAPSPSAYSIAFPDAVAALESMGFAGDERLRHFVALHRGNIQRTLEALLS